MYGIFTYIYHKNQLNVGKYTIHGSYEICLQMTKNARLGATVSNICALFSPPPPGEMIQFD